jgi:hypothetical protein
MTRWATTLRPSTGSSYRAPAHQHVEDRRRVSGESLAVGGQYELPVWPGAQEWSADGGLELADLAGEDGVPDAELTGRMAEAGPTRECEEPLDALLGARVGEDAPDVRGNAPAPPRAAATNTHLPLPAQRATRR